MKEEIIRILAGFSRKLTASWVSVAANLIMCVGVLLIVAVFYGLATIFIKAFYPIR